MLAGKFWFGVPCLSLEPPPTIGDVDIDEGERLAVLKRAVLLDVEAVAAPGVVSTRSALQV